MERNCKECIHHISGSCSVWECKPETLEEHDKNVRQQTIEFILDRVSLNCDDCAYIEICCNDYDLDCNQALADQLEKEQKE